MPEGPEVKIASDYFNKKIDTRKKLSLKLSQNTITTNITQFLIYLIIQQKLILKLTR